MEARWVRVVGDGLAYSGPCLLKSVAMQPVLANDYADIYDGNDTTSGKLFVRFITAVVVTWCICFGDGVPFDQGIYIDGKNADVVTTVCFVPL